MDIFDELEKEFKEPETTTTEKEDTGLMEGKVARLEKQLKTERLLSIFFCCEIIFLCGLCLGLMAYKEHVEIFVRPRQNV